MRIGIGLSLHKDPKKAGAQAVRDAKKAVPKPQLALVFGSIKLDQGKVHAGICSEVDPGIVLGGSSYAEITNAGVTDGSVTALLLSFEDAGVRFAGAEMGEEPEQAGRALLKALGPVETAEDRLPLALLCNPFSSGRDNEMLRVLNERLRGVAVYGGMCCSDYDLGMSHSHFFDSYQYAGSRLATKASRMALLDLPQDGYRAAFSFEHGWQPVGPEVVLTRCDGAKVYEAGGMPIFDYYRQFIGEEGTDEFFQHTVQRYGFDMIVEGDGWKRSILKLPVLCDFEEGCIHYFPAEDLQGRKVQLIHASRRGLVQGARQAAERCREALGEDPALLYMVSCCTRKAILHSRMDDEVDAVREVFGRDVPIFGYYTGGEIVPYLTKHDDVIRPDMALSGSHYHTTTVGLLALASRRPVKARVPKKAPGRKTEKDEAGRLKGLLAASERILDDTEGFMANLSRKSYKDSERIRKQNEVIYRYTPHDVWKQIGDNVAQGVFEIPDAEFKGAFMFLDVKGFTSYSEGHTAAEVVSVLNRIFKPATEHVYGSGGDIDKYIGDCIFAVFREPAKALEAAKRILLLFKEGEGEELPFSIRIGVNTGRAIRANVGGDDRREYTYIGDAVNTAQRLESACTPGRLLVCEGLHDRAKPMFPHVEQRKVTAKGKSAPLTAYECSL